MSDPWNPQQYHKFQEERSLPFVELARLIRRDPGMRVVDLGCGTGELTQRLHHELQAESTLGLDSSQAMLDKCPHEENLRFEKGDIQALEGRYDLIFSHAALQWIDDHEGLFAHLKSCLTERGQLAIQMPANFDHPSHVAAAELADEPRRFPVLKPEEYSHLLYRLGFAHQHVQLRVFPHVLPDRDGVLEWVKGTLLTYYQRRLEPDEYARFLERYRARLHEVLPDEKPFLYPFKRVLLWAAVSPPSAPAP